MKEKFTFFWKSYSPFSQWHWSTFKIGDISFPTAEHYMMYMKAMCFADKEIAEKILKVNHPAEAKKLGRQVKNFNQKAWESVCKKFVYDGNYAKFTQNPKLKEKLFETAGTTLAEASPYDKIWGLGLAEDDPRAQNRETWQGKNWLGEILTQLREDLLKEEK